jgi:L-malate glycosyltransferase
MKKIRLLHLITRLPIGGAERMLLGVLHNLDTERFDSIVCCIQDRGELAEEVESLGIPVHALGLMERGGFDRRVVPALRHLIREHKVELVHTHLYHANLYGRLAAHKEGISAIASVHNTYQKRKWYRHLINRYLARYTFRVTAGSVDVERDLLEIDGIPKEKVVCLPNCIDLTRVETTLTPIEAKQRLGFSATDRVIGTVGRVEEQKGHIFLLEAFARLRQLPGINDNLRLLIVGDGRLMPTLHETATRLGIADACYFPGNIALLADIYRAIDIFIMPSLWEGLSLAMLEAMAAGLPVVATDVGGALDVLGDNRWGLLIPPKDAEAIATTVAGLLADPLASNKMAIAGMQRVREHYSVVGLADQISGIYLSALEK